MPDVDIAFEAIVSAMNAMPANRRLQLSDLASDLKKHGVTGDHITLALKRIASMPGLEVVHLRADPWMACVQHRTMS